MQGNHKREFARKSMGKGGGKIARKLKTKILKNWKKNQMRQLLHFANIMTLRKKTAVEYLFYL